MKKKITGILLVGCLVGVMLAAAGCNQHASKEEDQTKEESLHGKEESGGSHAVTAEYDANEEIIIGEGLVYEVMEEDGSAMRVASYHDVALEDITIPDTVIYEEKEYQVTEIADSAFESNALLRRIVLPRGMKILGDNAFYSCPELTEVVFSDTVEVLGASCFAECPKLSKVQLPSSLTALGMESFSNCVAITSITIPGKLESMDNAVFYGCEQLKECRFEKGVTKIGDEMFTNCYALSQVEIPETVTAVGSEAFWGCSALTEIALPDQISTIGPRAFYSSGLKELRLPDGLSGITLELLDGMEVLEKIIVPKAKQGTYEKVFQNYGITIETY